MTFVVLETEPRTSGLPEKPELDSLLSCISKLIVAIVFPPKSFFFSPDGETEAKIRTQGWHPFLSKLLVALVGWGAGEQI